MGRNTRASPVRMFARKDDDNDEMFTEVLDHYQLELSASIFLAGNQLY